MTTQTGSYDFKAAKAAHDDAAKKASDYITEITDDGIMVHAEGEGPDDTPKPTGWHISNVLEFIREGVSRFWIGLKNQGDTTPTVRIGKAYNSQASDNESHMELDYHSMKLIDKEGSAYFYVSDLRNERGQMVETFTAPGGTNIFEVSMVPNGNASQAWATVDGADTQITDISTSSTNVHIADFPAAGAEVVIGYVPRWPGEAKAFTYGSRGSGAVGNMSFSAGYGNVADGKAAFAEGYGSTASGQASHAEGSGTALGIFSHAEGSDTVAGEYAHAEGRNAVASDGASHAEGFYTEASGYASHAQNRGTVAASEAQTALGKYNVEDANGTYAAIIGNGTADNARSDALRVEWDGDVLIAGDVKNMSGTNLYANASHGNHVPATQTANNAVYLRNDNTWHTVTPSDIGALALSGGTMTGRLAFKDGTAMPNASTNTDFFAVGFRAFTNGGGVWYKGASDFKSWLAPGSLYSKNTAAGFDRDGANPSSALYGEGFTIQDKDGERVCFLRPNRLADGTMQLQLNVCNENTSGSEVTNHLILGVNRSGTRTVSLAESAPWRTALGLDGLVKVVSATSSSIPISANSNHSYAPTLTIPSGYTLVGALGCKYTANNANLSTAACYLYSSNQVAAVVCNHSSSAKNVAVTTYGLCVKSICVG